MLQKEHLKKLFNACKKGGESSSQGEKYVTMLTGPAARAIMDALNEKAGLNYYEVSRGGETVVIVNESDCIKIKPKAGWKRRNGARFTAY
jgi:hypothetical protein